MRLLLFFFNPSKPMTKNVRSETKAVGDTFTEPILKTYIYGRVNATLILIVLRAFCTQSI